MDPPIDWQLLARYLAGVCSSSEQQTVEAWVEADPTRRRLMSELARIWDASAAPAPPPEYAMDLDADWARLSEAMQAVDPPTPAQPRRTRRPRRHRDRRRTPSLQHILHVLLAGLALIGSIWLGVELWTPSSPTDTTFRELIAERGERANVQLVDGTEVTLNVDSRLRTPAAFDDVQRTVYLEGEAYFDVATDSMRPFVVYTGDAMVNVHGTAFNVRSYPEDHRVQVAVVEGAVSLRPQQTRATGSGARLEPGQIGRLAARDTMVTTQTVDSVAALLGWMEGRLIFENETLPEVAARLERWYNLRFDIADPALDSLRLTANLKSRSVENVLDVITASLGIEYHMHQDTVVLSDDAPSVHLPPTP